MHIKSLFPEILASWSTSEREHDVGAHWLEQGRERTYRSLSVGLGWQMAPEAWNRQRKNVNMVSAGQQPSDICQIRCLSLRLIV